MILVLGGGFGLYGHLAALACMDRPIATLERYRSTIEARPELAGFADGIAWYADESAALACADAVVLARRPQDNNALAHALAGSGEGGTLVIEKPIAASPQEAEALANRLEEDGRNWAVPYLLIYCDWFRWLQGRVAKGGAVDIGIDWSFRRSPALKPWKSSADEGGGALAFYFIHCIAAAERLLPRATCEWSRGSLPHGGQRIDLVATRAGIRLAIRFDLDAADTAFRVREGGGLLFESATPFGGNSTAGSRDPRIPILQRFYCEAVFGEERQQAAFHAAVNRIWREMAAEMNGYDRG